MRDQQPHGHGYRQAGQALPLGLALILVGALSGLVLYNTGQSAIEKTRLVNAADAAAYSGVQWQARALNFQAYTNRAMVANQVTLAQAVTLQSWSTYGQIMGENISTVLSAVPFVNAIAAGVESVMVVVNQVVSPIAGTMLSVVDTINQGIGSAQSAMFASTFVATPAVVKAVVEGSDPRFNADSAYGVLGTLGNLSDWNDFTAGVGTGEDDYGHMRERAQLIRESQQAFTTNRDWEFFDNYLYIAPGVKINVIKEGRTELIEREGGDGLQWEWKAKDTLSFHTKINLLFTRDHIEVPIGYGGAFANNSDDRDERDESIEAGACSGYASYFGNCARMLDENERAESLVDANAKSLDMTESLIPMSGYSGLREFRRLSDGTREKDFPTLRLRVEATMPLTDTMSSESFTGSEPFDAPLVARGDVASSVSIAEAYFKPPDADLWRAGDTLEFANAYSPFWSVRLAPVSVEERLAAFALRGSGSSVPDGNGVRAPTGQGQGQGQGQESSQGQESIRGQFTMLADAYGVDTTQVSALMAGAEGAGSLVEAAAREYGSAVLDTVVDDIRTELEDKLKTAVEDILRGLARRAAESAVGTRVLDTVEDVEDFVGQAEQAIDIDGLRETASGAIAEVEALQLEFQRVDEALVQNFAPFFEQEVSAWRGAWGGRLRRLASESNRPFSLFSIPSASSVEDGILRDLAREARRERRRLIERLAQEYTSIANAASERIDMTPRSARQIITMLLSGYEDAADGEVDFTLFGDADMDLPEPEPEPGESDPASEESIDDA